MGGTVKDTAVSVFGMRSFAEDMESVPRGMFYLNGKSIRLRGANTMGYEQQDVLRGDFDMLLYDMLMAKACNMNFLRLTQRPVQKEIYELCDCIGLMLQTDLPLFTVMRRTKFAEGVRQAEEMEQFWAACCMLRPGVFSSTEEVFACYQRFLAASASSGGLTKIRFNKEFRKWLELRGLRAVTYTRRHCSRQQPSLWGYRGLALTPPPPSSAPAVPPPPCPQDPISTRLEEISRYRIQSDGSLEVRVREIPVPEP